MWSLTIVEKGFSCYTVIDIDEINIEGESIHVVAGDMELWLPTSDSVVNDHSISYRGDRIEVYVERL